MPEQPPVEFINNVDIDTPTLLAVMVQLCAVAVIELTKKRGGDLGVVRDDLLRLLQDLSRRIAETLPEGVPLAPVTVEVR